MGRPKDALRHDGPWSLSVRVRGIVGGRLLRRKCPSRSTAIAVGNSVLIDSCIGDDEAMDKRMGWKQRQERERRTGLKAAFTRARYPALF
jgi:type II secretory ATPase GspE/PulE/Tfp pilus assembly ATPase PilB-like protein